MLDKSEVTANIKVFMRPQKFEFCLQAVINAGIEKVIVGYDGPDNLWNQHKEICNYYSDTANINIHKYKFNIGLSYVRNRMVKLTETEYIMQLDDDNYIPSNVIDTLPFLKNHTQIGAVAFGWIFPNGYPVFDAFDVEIINNYLLRTYKPAKTVEYYCGLPFTYTFDFIPNCAMYKREVFDDVQWDEHYIISGEHEDFFLTIMQQTNWKFAICPALYAYHDYSTDNKEFLKYRRGAENCKSQKYLLDKWNLKGIIPQRDYSMFLEGNTYRNQLLERDKLIRKQLQTNTISENNMIKF